MMSSTALIGEGDEMARPLQRALRNTMWENCGVVRSEDKLQQALIDIAQLRERAKNLDVRPSSEGYQDLALALDLKASLASAEASVRGAIERKESRGAHQRTDYPDTDPYLKVNFVIQLNEHGEQIIEAHPVAPIPKDLLPWNTSEEFSVAGRLLE